MTAQRKFKPGDLVMVRSGATAGKIFECNNCLPPGSRVKGRLVDLSMGWIWESPFLNIWGDLLFGGKLELPWASEYNLILISPGGILEEEPSVTEKQEPVLA